MRCPLFDHRAQTCGTAGQTFIEGRSGEVRNLGCWCYLPLKTELPANCWARNAGLHEIGWPDELNSFPERVSTKDAIVL